MTRDDQAACLAALEKKALWLACWMIHNANHLRPNPDGVKIGGHQASSASLATIMAALYFHLLRPADRVAVKPHASPVFHAIQYLLGQQTREKLENFRGYGGAQSYPSRTKDVDDVDFSTGSVGLGVAVTSFASLVQDYLRLKDLGTERPEGRMIALVGDAELDEGNIFEAMLEGWKHGLRNTWWIIDYNRQSLDGVIREGLYGRFEDVFKALGWQVVTLKYGQKLEAAFKKPGGDRLRHWIDNCPNPLYSALTYQGGAAWRKRLMDDIGDQGPVTALLDAHDDEALAALMTNLGGHDLNTIIETLGTLDDDRPVCVIAYTIKGFGTPLAGHKDNHSGLMTPDQMAAFRQANGIAEGQEWDHFAGLEQPEAALKQFLQQVPFASEGTRRLPARRIPVPEKLSVSVGDTASTQEGFGRILYEIAGAGGELADRIVTTSPDVTVSTNLGGWVNRRGLFARKEIADTFRDERVPSAQKWGMGPKGQHIELGIAENNLFLQLAALGLSHSLFGERLLPIGTLYDPFIYRGADALNYACYQDARFILVATPSGVTLAPEGGAHQSIGTPLVGMAQDGLASFEPSYVDELAVIMRWAFDYIQRGGDEQAPEKGWLRDEKGGSVYLRLSTRPVEQLPRTLDRATEQAIIDGAYWLRPPGPRTDLVIAYTGAVAPDVMAAAASLSTGPSQLAVLAITSADRLNAGWHAADRARARGERETFSHVESLLQAVPRDAQIITVIDGHPAALSWLGSVWGHRVRALGVEHFGQTGTVRELYKHFRLDASAIRQAAELARLGAPGKGH
jgi:pyruvate dehydrogenase E1 component